MGKLGWLIGGAAIVLSTTTRLYAQCAPDTTPPAVFLPGPAVIQEGSCVSGPFQALPLNDLGTETYKGFMGGLYPGGSNTVPMTHASAGLAKAALVTPLDTMGAPSASGKIALVSIGMSNTTQEFCHQSNPAACNSWSFMGQAAVDA